MFEQTRERTLSESFCVIESHHSTTTDGLPTPIDGYQLHYANCFAFLDFLRQKIVNKAVSDELTTSIPMLQQVRDLKGEYDAARDYGALYNQFMLDLYGYFENRLKEKRPITDAEYALLTAIYANENCNFERCYKSIEFVLSTLQHTDYKACKEKTFSLLSQNLSSLAEGSIVPYKRGSDLMTLATENYGNWLVDYRPQTTTSLPSKVQTDFMGKTTLLRMGTQSERVNAAYQINPLLRAFLRAEQERHPSDTTLVYFNLLELKDHTGLKDLEQQGSHALITLAENQTNFIVLSLPADSGLLKTEKIGQHEKDSTLGATASQLIGLFTDAEEGVKTEDCYVSPAAREKLFPDSTEEKVLNDLWLNTCTQLGFDKDQLREISPAEEVALAFHFLKFVFPEYVLQTLTPKFSCMVCKDGIDRGGVALAYYTLIKSIIASKPLSEESFLQLLHGPALQTKARTVNKHILYIWQALNVFIRTPAYVVPDWLTSWVNKNRPNSGVLFAHDIQSSNSSSGNSSDMEGEVASTSTQTNAEPMFSPLLNPPSLAAAHESDHLSTASSATQTNVTTTEPAANYTGQVALTPEVQPVRLPVPTPTVSTRFNFFKACFGGGICGKTQTLEDEVTIMPHKIY